MATEGMATELIIEHWTAPSGAIDYLWSVWRDGKRLKMGGAHGTSEAAEAEGRSYCRHILHSTPDRVSWL